MSDTRRAVRASAEEVAAVVLRCSNCAQELPGADADRAWACAPCATAYEIEGASFAPRPYAAWRVPIDDADRGGVIWLPFWRIAHAAEIASDDEPARIAVERAVAAGRTWIRAFWLDNAFLVGDAGQTLTKDAHDETLDAASLPRIAGARIPSRDALRLAELFALAAADREADVTPVTLRLVAHATALIAVPFRDAGRDIVCAVDGRAFRKSAVPDLDEIAAAVRASA